MGKKNKTKNKDEMVGSQEIDRPSWVDKKRWEKMSLEEKYKLVNS